MISLLRNLLLPLAFLTLSGARVSAETLAQVCNRFSNTDQMISCLKAARGLPMDEGVLNVCAGFSYSAAIMQCITVSAGREYTQEEIGVCTHLSNTDKVMQCLASAGRLVRPGGRSCSERVSEELRICRRASGDAQSVLACLERSLGL